MPSKIEQPSNIQSEHIVDSFNSGDEVLDQWLKKKAYKNDKLNASRTYVVCSDGVVIGYYCLSTGAINHAEAVKKATRNMPDPIPVMVLGRLAVDQQWQRMGIGKGMLKDALLRTLQAAEIVGVKALVVHAKSEEAKVFYESLGFLKSPTKPLTVMLLLKDAVASIEDLEAKSHSTKVSPA